MAQPGPIIDIHNEAQRSYYSGRKLHANIAPVETPYVTRHLDEVLATAAPGAGARILDLGCGAGRHAVLLQARGYRVEGLDLSADLLRNLPPEIPAHCADAAAPPAELRGQFDVVLGFFMLHHLLDLRAAFGGVAALLKPGGRAVFIEPNPYNPLYYVQIALTPHMRWHAERGILNMRTAEIFPALTGAGLRAPAVRRLGFLPPFLRNRSWGGAVDAAAERVGWLEPVLPFQIFSAMKPDAR